MICPGACEIIRISCLSGVGVMRLRSDSFVPALPVSTATRRVAALEVCALIFGVLAIMWIVPFMPNPRLGRRILTVLLLLLLVHARVREEVGWRDLGFRWDNFLPVLGRLLPFIGGLIAVLLSIGAAAETLRFEVKSWTGFLTLPAWALLQQYLLLAFAHRRFRIVAGPGVPCIAMTTLLFGLVHLPNPGLALVCTVGGFVWAREYERSPNLLAHMLTHAVGSVVLMNSLPRELLKNMVVGYRYLLT
jgi:membrane protease YdiL (CAAX protease family)